MIDFNFIIGTFEDSIDQILTWLGDKPENNVVHFNDFTGKGYLLIAELEKDFFIKAWDYTLHDDTRFNIKAAGDNHPVVFTINYLLTPDSYTLEQGSFGPLKKINKLNSVLFFSNQNEFTFSVKAGRRVKALDICFTYKWLLNQFPVERPDSPGYILSRQRPGELLFFETFSIDDLKIITDIMEKAFNNDWDIIFFKARVLTLMNELLKNVFNKADKDLNKSPGQTDVMIEVEKKLSSVLHEKLPNLKAIAKEFSISESTLKRQFKQVYGKAIYEYYLYKKMEMARRMLMEQDRAISQVAFSLGYENTSSFIRVFKKQFGESPGLLRRQKS